MSDWYYTVGPGRMGPISFEELQQLAQAGALSRTQYVWCEGMSNWEPAGSVAGLFAALPELPPLPVEPSSPAPPRRNMLRNLGTRLSGVTRLPEIGDVPVKDILVSGLTGHAGPGHPIEEVLAAGTERTTPNLAEVQVGWPRPRVFWTILAGSTVIYSLLRLGIESTGNARLIPGMLVIGSFVVPLSVAVFFFEMNSPRNVSFYQLLKLLLMGGALSILATLGLSFVIQGSGAGGLVPSVLTGVIEEMGKLLTLLLMVRYTKYRWQLNGAVFGAAIGAGFAGLESAGYAFQVLLQPYQGYSVFDAILLRGILAPGGHVIWGAMVGAALWEVKGDRPFEAGMLTHPTVVRRWLVAVVLHSLWDMALIRFNVLGLPVQQVVLSIVGWYIIFAVLKQGLAEVERAKDAEVEPVHTSSA